MAPRSSAGLGHQQGSGGGGLGAGRGEGVVLAGEGSGLFLAGELFRGGLPELAIELGDALFLTFVQAGGLFEVGGGVAAAFFQSREGSGGFGGFLLEVFAFRAKLLQLPLNVREAEFQGGALRFKRLHLALAAGDQGSAGLAGVLVAVGGEGPLL